MSTHIRFVLPGIILFSSCQYSLHGEQQENIFHDGIYDKYVNYRPAQPPSKVEFIELACIYNKWSLAGEYKFTEHIQHGIETLLDNITLHQANEILRSRKEERQFLCDMLEARVYYERTRNTQKSEVKNSASRTLLPRQQTMEQLSHTIHSIFTTSNMQMAAYTINSTNIPLEFNQERRTFATEIVCYWFTQTMQDAISFATQEIKVCEQAIERMVRHESMLLQESAHVRLKPHCQLAYTNTTKNS